jgi:hypothetical protein
LKVNPFFIYYKKEIEEIKTALDDLDSRIDNIERNR